MTSFLKNCFSVSRFWNNVELQAKEKVFKYKLSDYDSTYRTPMSVLKFAGLRLTRNDPPFTRLCWNIFYWFEFINLFVVTWLESIQMVLRGRGGSFQDAVEIFRMMPCVGYLILAMAKSYKMVYERSVYDNLINELRSMWPQHVVTEQEYNIIKKALRQLNLLVKAYNWFNNVTLVLFLIEPFLVILRRSSGHDEPLVLPFFYWLPFDPYSSAYYEIILILQCWHGLLSIWLMLASDMLFCVFLSHITTQFDLLSIRISKFVYVPIDNQLIENYPLGVYSEEYFRNNKRGTRTLDDDEWEIRHQRELSEIIVRHHALIRLSGDVENLFSFALLVNFFNSSIIICFCGFCSVIVEKWNEMVYKLFLTTTLFQTWMLCMYGQKLLESSEGISNALYNSGWYKASKKIRSSVLFMILRAQKEVRITTYGFSILSLSTYTTIIKTSWSYFTLLLNVYKK